MRWGKGILYCNGGICLCVPNHDVPSLSLRGSDDVDNSCFFVFTFSFDVVCDFFMGVLLWKKAPQGYGVGGLSFEVFVEASGVWKFRGESKAKS